MVTQYFLSQKPKKLSVSVRPFQGRVESQGGHIFKMRDFGSEKKMFLHFLKYPTLPFYVLKSKEFFSQKK